MSDPTPAFVPVNWFGKPPDAATSFLSMPSMALWRLDQDEQVEFRAAAADRHMVCAHVSGSIDWAAHTGSRHYERACLPSTFCLQLAGEQADVRYARAHASFIHFYMPRRWLADRAEDFGRSATPSSLELVDPMNARCDDVGRWALVAARALRDGLPGGPLEVEAAGLFIASALLRKHSNVSVKPVPSGGLAGWQLKRACDALASWETAIDLASLAAEAGLSPSHFCRAFKQSTGLPPHRYQLMLRLKCAKDLLANGRASIAEVAAAVGYDDQGQLARLFRKEVGTTPSQYRRERHA